MFRALYISLLLLTATLFIRCGNLSRNGTGQVSFVPSEAHDTLFTAALLQPYLGLKEALAADDASLAARYAALLGRVADSVRTEMPGACASCAGPADSLLIYAAAIAQTFDADCELQRIYFGRVSGYMQQLLQQYPIPGATVYLQYCPMAFNTRGASWLSTEKSVRNPYFGIKMLECGEVSDSITAPFHGTVPDHQPPYPAPAG